MELLDSGKQVVAQANLKLSVLVTGDEVTLDCLLVGWVALVKAKGASAENAPRANAAVEIVNALAGGGGASVRRTFNKGYRRLAFVFGRTRPISTVATRQQ